MIEALTPYLLFSAFFTALAMLLLKPKPPTSPPLPPGPKPLPLFGNLLDLGPNPHRSLARLARAHGPIMHLKLGTVRTVVISSPNSAKEVLKTKAQLISGRKIPDALRGFGHHEGSMAWSPPDQSWRFLRSLTKTHLFSTHALDANQSLRKEKVQELVAYINGKKGEVLKIGRAAFCTSLNLLSTMFLSVNMVDLRSESTQEWKDLMWGLMEEAGRPNISDFFPLLAPFDLQGRRRRFTAYYKKLNDFCNQMIEHRLGAMGMEGGGRNGDILDALLESSREEGSKLSKRTIISLIMEFLTVGSETSSTTMEWAMAELLHRPELISRAREEITNVIGSKKEIQESDISKLPFLQAVLKETLRLHPPGPLLLPHKAEASTEINGYLIPKNTQVIVNVWAIGRDDRVWVNPDRFEPERFMGGGADSEIDFRGQHFELTPFGSGRRICPGLLLGVRMVQLMLASVIQSFEWSLPRGKKPEHLDLREKFGFTLVMADPLEAVASNADRES